MLRHRAHFPVSRALCVWAGLLTMSCSGHAEAPWSEALPTSPSAPASVNPGDIDRSLPAAAGSATLFAFTNGTFVLTTAAGDTLTGLSFGHLAFPAMGRTTISVELFATSGSGMFQGASGIVTGDGGGQFEFGKAGHVVLSSLDGVVQTTAQPNGLRFHGTLGGTSELSCSASARTQLIIRGDGSVATIGRTTMLLTTELENTNCF